MESSQYDLARRCKLAYLAWGQTPSPPLESMQLAEARDLIDDPLPDLLIDLYTTVGNGGFGPQGGLLGLGGGFVGSDSQMTSDEMYREFMWDTPKEEGWDWPAELLPLAEGGCGLMYCVDLDSTEGDIHLLDPNGFQAGDNLLDYVQPCHSTLYGWLHDWSVARPPIQHVASTRGRWLISRLISRARGKLG